MCDIISQNDVNMYAPCWRGWSYDLWDPCCPQDVVFRNRLPRWPPLAHSASILRVCKALINSSCLQKKWVAGFQSCGVRSSLLGSTRSILGL